LESFDVIIIGTGQAGPSLAARLASEGKQVAIIERKLFGGTCVNTGCIPTKTLIASARVAYVARRADEYGIQIPGPVTVDMKKVKARKDSVAGVHNDRIPQWMLRMENLTPYKGHARFESAHVIQVGEEKLQAENIFINVGGRAFIPSMPGLDDVQFWTNSDMMAVDFLPDHLIIVGGSYIGLEFAQMYRRFGSKVTIVERSPRLIGREDQDVSDGIREILENEGVSIRLNSECITARKNGTGVTVGLDCDSGDKDLSGSHLLLAVGRIPNTHDLGLEKAGVETDERGYIKVDDQLQTNIKGIWALGDCNGKGAFTHTAYNDFEVVAANLLEKNPRRISDRILAYALYIDPPLGRVGMTENQVRESGRKTLIGKRLMSQIGRARERGETSGFMKILIDADSREILGAAILGIGGDEIIHSIIDIMYARKPYTVIQQAMHIHPTVSELIPTMLGELKPFE